MEVLFKIVEEDILKSLWDWVIFELLYVIGICVLELVNIKK